LALAVVVDYLFTRRVLLPALTFFHANILRNLSSFYGPTDITYHLVQSLPIMLFPVWWWFGEGFFACLLPSMILPARLAKLNRPESMKLLARGLAFTIFVLSFAPHSEWRFLHPLLPALLIFTLSPISKRFVPTIFGCYRLSTAIRQYTRFGKGIFYLCLIVPVLPWIYLNAFHGRSQVEVMNVLRRGDVGVVSGLIVLAPCHSMPWSSHLHMDIPGWFLTCEPPLQ
jgi:phosphatidylinositol glycan class B